MGNYVKWAGIYDAIYKVQGKDYEKEALELIRLIRYYWPAGGTDLFDVACGTGLHAYYFSKMGFWVCGMDIDPEMLMIAKKRNPNLTFAYGDMTKSPAIGRRYDIVTCLFSAIGYVRTRENLERVILWMADCVLPGGVLIIEPWLTPENFKKGGVYADFVNEPDLKISRFSASRIEGNLSIIDFHFLVGRPEGIEYFAETHELGLFTFREYCDAFEKAGLDVRYIPDWIGGRGLYLGLKPG